MNRCCDTGAEAAARWSGTPRGIATALESCINFDQRFMDPSPSRSRVLDISIRGQTIDKNMKEAIYGAVQHRRVEDVLSGAVQGPTSARRPTRRESGARNLCAAHHSPLRRAPSVAREIFARLLHGERNADQRVRDLLKTCGDLRHRCAHCPTEGPRGNYEHGRFYCLDDKAWTRRAQRCDVGAAPDEPLAMTTGVAMGKASRAGSSNTSQRCSRVASPPRIRTSGGARATRSSSRSPTSRHGQPFRGPQRQ